MSYVVQGTGEWLKARCGKLTASRMADAMATLKNGKPAAARINLLKELIAERMTGESVDHYTSPEMRWGIEQEPNAKAEYEEVTGHILVPATFYDHPEIENFGATPDSLQGKDTVVEFKCPKTSTHVSWIMAGVVPEEHRPQILAQLACTRRKHAVFASYDPRISGPKRLFVREWTPEPEEIAAVESAARDFLVELERVFDMVTEAA